MHGIGTKDSCIRSTIGTVVLHTQTRIFYRIYLVSERYLDQGCRLDGCHKEKRFSAKVETWWCCTVMIWPAVYTINLCKYTCLFYSSFCGMPARLVVSNEAIPVVAAGLKTIVSNPTELQEVNSAEPSPTDRRFPYWRRSKSIRHVNIDCTTCRGLGRSNFSDHRFQIT